MEIHGLQILFQMINFGVVFGAISILLYKPIIKMLDERAKKIEAGQLAAQTNLKEKDEIEALKKRAKTSSEKEAAKAFEKAEAEAKELKAKLSKEAREEVKAWKEKEMGKWEAQKESLKKEAQTQISDMAIAIAGKILGSSVDKKVSATLISTSIKELEKSL